MRETASHSIYLCSRLQIDQSGHVFLPLVLVSKSFMPKQTREKRLEKEILRVLSSRPEFSGSVFSLLY